MDEDDDYKPEMTPETARSIIKNYCRMLAGTIERDLLHTDPLDADAVIDDRPDSPLWQEPDEPLDHTRVHIDNFGLNMTICCEPDATDTERNARIPGLYNKLTNAAAGPVMRETGPTGTLQLKAPVNRMVNALQDVLFAEGKDSVPLPGGLDDLLNTANKGAGKGRGI